MGPTEDGGYYYIATSSLYPELFRGIEWSTEEVYITTLKRAYTLGLRTAVLASVRDLDRPEDLEAFNEELYLGDFSELDWHSSSRVGKFLAKKLAP